MERARSPGCVPLMYMCRPAGAICKSRGVVRHTWNAYSLKFNEICAFAIVVSPINNALNLHQGVLLEFGANRKNIYLAWRNLPDNWSRGRKVPRIPPMDDKESS